MGRKREVKVGIKSRVFMWEVVMILGDVALVIFIRFYCAVWRGYRWSFDFR